MARTKLKFMTVFYVGKRVLYVDKTTTNTRCFARADGGKYQFSAHFDVGFRLQKSLGGSGPKEQSTCLASRHTGAASRAAIFPGDDLIRGPAQDGILVMGSIFTAESRHGKTRL